MQKKDITYPKTAKNEHLPNITFAIPLILLRRIMYGLHGHSIQRSSDDG